MEEQQKGAQLLYSCLKMRKLLNKLISNGNLSQGEYQVLRNIRMSYSGFPINVMGSNIKAAALSDKLEMSRPSITRILNALEKRGYITRNIDIADRRSVSIQITAAGIEVLETANKALLSISEGLVVSLGDVDSDKLIELVDKLAEIYKGMIEENGRNDDEE